MQLTGLSPMNCARVLLALTGMASLSAQLAWERSLAPLFGVHSHSITVIIALFMAGCGLGAWLGKLWCLRAGNGFTRFARVQAVTAVWLFATRAAFRPELWESWFVVAGTDPQSASFLLSRLAVGVLLILPPTTAMGTTLPLLLDAIRRQDHGQTAGTLYAANTAGGILGIASTTFLAVPWLGVRGALVAAAACSATAAVAASILARRTDRSASYPPLDTPAYTQDFTGSRRLVMAYFCSGAAALAMEVLWIRGLTIGWNQSVYVFASVLAVYLVGIALGSAVIGSHAERSAKPIAIFSTLQGTLAILAPVSLYLQGHLLRINPGDSASLSAIAYRYLGVPLAVVLAPTFLMGAAFPYLMKAIVRRSGGAAAGALLAANQGGCVFGAMAAGFWWIPEFGTRGSVMIAGILWLASMVLSEAGRTIRALRALFFLAAFTALGYAFPETYYRDLLSGRENEEILDVREGPSGIVSFGKAGEHRWIIRLNGRPECSTEKNVMMNYRALAMAPLATHPAPESGLLIGIGGGVTARAALEDSRVKSLRCVELSPEMVWAAELLGEKLGAPLDASRFLWKEQDGRNDLLLEDRNYDFILTGTIRSFTSMGTLLYSREYFELCSRRLRPGGVLAQSLITRNDDEDRLVTRTMLAVFPETLLWQGDDGGKMLLGFKNSDHALPERIADGQLLPSSFLRDWAGEGPILEDDRPLLEYYLLRPEISP